MFAERAGAVLGGCFAVAIGVSGACGLAADGALDSIADAPADGLGDASVDAPPAGPVDAGDDPPLAAAFDAPLDAAFACDAAGSASKFSGGLLVVKSTVTFRIGSGAVAGSVGEGAIFGFGPDNNSGTTSTTSATRIDAPISRSLTRRSITAKYIRVAAPPAAILWTRANRSPVPQYERSRKPRFDPAASPHSRPRHRRSRRCPWR